MDANLQERKYNSNVNSIYKSPFGKCVSANANTNTFTTVKASRTPRSSKNLRRQKSQQLKRKTKPKRNCNAGSVGNNTQIFDGTNVPVRESEWNVQVHEREETCKCEAVAFVSSAP